ncbi:MAG: hypothetical protein JNK82_07995 [Myxococcaceae bacterium]|nr:hypothetical protein [Myxococcaceae bacterium]
MHRVDAGHYAAELSITLAEGECTVSVSYPDAGLTAAATTFIDRTNPSVEVRLSRPPSRLAADGGVNEVDPEMPGAFRRDESVTVTVDSPDPDLAGAIISVAGGNSFYADAGCLSRFDGGSCLEHRLDLWNQPMFAFHQTVAFEVRARDSVSNATSTDGGRVDVTRHKWRREVPGIIDSFALKRGGDLIAHVVSPSSVTSWNAAGALRWSVASTATDGRLMLGDQQGEARIYLTEVKPIGELGISVLGSNDPATAPVAGLFPGVAGVFSGGLGAPVLVSKNDEIAYFPVRHGDALSLFAWNRGTGATSSADAGQHPGTHLVVNATTDNRHIFVPMPRNNLSGNAGAFVFTFPFATGAPPELVERVAQPAEVTSVVPRTEQLRLFAISDGGRPSQVNATGEGFVSLPLAVAAPVVGPNQYFFNESRAPAPLAPTLCELRFGATTPTCVNVKSYGGAPVLGAPAGTRRTLYVPTMDDVSTQMGHRVTAINTTTLMPEWSTPLSVNGVLARPVSLDCSRDSGGGKLAGRPGVLYTTASIAGASPATILTAIIVDSPGVDGDAPWPMEKHDPRNTNNLTTPLGEFSCP